MLVLCIILLILLIIALLRFGLILSYSGDGLKLWVKVGFFRFLIMKDKNSDKAEKKKKQKKKKDKVKKEPDKKIKIDKDLIFDILHAVKEALNRFRNRLLINELTLHCLIAGDDHAKTAITYGRANAILCSLLPIMDRKLRIKKRDIKFFTDFVSTKVDIYARINISIAVWEVFYIAFAFLPILIAIFKNRTSTEKLNKKIGKDNQDGKTTNQQFDGDNNAKN